MPLGDEVQAQRLDEGAFAHARHAADTQAERLARVGQQRREQLICLRAVIGAGGFEQRDGFGHGAALGRRLAMQDAPLDIKKPHASVLPRGLVQEMKVARG